MIDIIKLKKQKKFREPESKGGEVDTQAIMQILCEIYFNIAANVIGEQKVREYRDKMIDTINYTGEFVKSETKTGGQIDCDVMRKAMNFKFITKPLGQLQTFVSGVRPLRLTYMELQQGEKIPPFYFGYTYREYDRMIEVWHIIPLNYIIRWCRHIRYLWNKFRANPTGRIDKQITRIEKETSERWRKYYDDNLETIVKIKFEQMQQSH